MTIGAIKQAVDADTQDTADSELLLCFLRTLKMGWVEKAVAQAGVGK